MSGHLGFGNSVISAGDMCQSISSSGTAPRSGLRSSRKFNRLDAAGSALHLDLGDSHDSVDVVDAVGRLRPYRTDFREP